MQDAFTVRQNVLRELQLALIREFLHAEVLLLERLLDHGPVEPCEGVLDGEVRGQLSPFLLVVNAMDLLKHQCFELIMSGMCTPVNSVLHHSLVILIHSDEALHDLGRVQRVGLVEVVRRVDLLAVCVQVVQLDNAKQVQVALVGVFAPKVVRSDLKDAVKVALRDNSQRPFIRILVFPLHAREDQIDGLLIVQILPLQVNHVIGDPAVQGLVARAQDLDGLGLEAEVELVLEVR